jgi:hypothetical protein
MELQEQPPVMEITVEQATKSVAAAYDSVNLIADLLAKETLTAEETATLARNKEHIKIMLGKIWFVEVLTPEQKTELEAATL